MEVTAALVAAALVVEGTRRRGRGRSVVPTHPYAPGDIDAAGGLAGRLHLGQLLLRAVRLLPVHADAAFGTLGRDGAASHGLQADRVDADLLLLCVLLLLRVGAVVLLGLRVAARGLPLGAPEGGECWAAADEDGCDV